MQRAAASEARYPRSGRLIDGSGAKPRKQVRIHVDRGLIKRVAPDTQTPPRPRDNQRIIDAREQTLMPGLIDAHAHIFNSAACSLEVGTGLGAALNNVQRALRAIKPSAFAFWFHVQRKVWRPSASYREQLGSRSAFSLTSDINAPAVPGTTGALRPPCH